MQETKELGLFLKYPDNTVETNFFQSSDFALCALEKGCTYFTEAFYFQLQFFFNFQTAEEYEVYVSYNYSIFDNYNRVGYLFMQVCYWYAYIVRSAFMSNCSSQH